MNPIYVLQNLLLTWLYNRQQRKLAEYNRRAGAAWAAFERGELSHEEYETIKARR